jgi:hypothetical protein
MSEITRYDLMPVKATITEDGYMVDTPVIARVGVQIYQNADGSIRREFRPPEEVFNADSLASFMNKPITDDHPQEPVSAKNFKKYAIGVISGAAYQDGDNVRAPIVIHDGEAVDKAIKGGKRELSVGYSVTLDETPGEWNGQKYDAIQRNIKANHLSLVKRGRAGTARLSLDAAAAVSLTADDMETIDMSEKMSVVKLDSGIEYAAAQEVVVAYQQLKADAANHQSKVDEANARADKAQAEADALKAEVAKIEQIKADSYAQARADIEARAKLETVAKEFKVDCKDLDDKAVKLAVIKAVRGDADLSEKSDAYIDAAFDMAIEMKSDAAIASQRATVKVDSKPVEKSGDKYRAFMQSLGKKD